jgi:hypothetical protein
LQRKGSTMNLFRSPLSAAEQRASSPPRVVAPVTGPDSQSDSANGLSIAGSTTGTSSGATTVGAARAAAGVLNPRPAGAAAGDIGGFPSEAGFVAMQVAFRASGGLARGDDLVRWLQGHSNGDVASLARLIVTAELFSFEWRDTFWVPMFQFDLDDLSIKRGPRKVLTELATEFDSWNLAVWFAQPNSWLNNARPVDQLDHNLAAVLRAAHSDRLIAAG